MTEAPELLKLAERIEQATGPDRELDAEIDIALGRFPERAYTQRMGMRPKGTPQLDRKTWMIRDKFTQNYTSSIDSAMTLVPEGWHFNLGTGWRDDKGPWARVYSHWATMHLGHSGEGKTLPLALCAAALRARSAS